jgi:hypothetical protein
MAAGSSRPKATQRQSQAACDSAVSKPARIGKEKIRVSDGRMASFQFHNSTGSDPPDEPRNARRIATKFGPVLA